MPVFTKLSYQEEAISSLVDKTTTFFDKAKPCSFRTPDRSQLLLKAFTGAGKTYIMAKYVEAVLSTYPFNRPDQHTLFIFMTPGKGALKYQSYGSFNTVLSNRSSLQLTLDDDFKAKTAKDTLIFCNWEKAKNGNIYNANQERDSLYDVISKDPVYDHVIMLIDEEHYAKNSALSKEVIDQFHPDLIVNASATPSNKLLPNPDGGTYKLFQADNTVAVALPDLVLNNVIKRHIQIDPDLHSVDTDDILLAALSKQVELAAAYRKIAEAFHVPAQTPLVLIQIKNDSSIDGRSTGKGSNVAYILEHLIKVITENNLPISLNQLKVYLSNYTNSQYQLKDLADIKESQDAVLIFKQGVDMGVDIPRAAILVRLRDVKSATFNVQVIGRIVRTLYKGINSPIANAMNDPKSITSQAYVYNQYLSENTKWEDLEELEANSMLVADPKLQHIGLKSASAFEDSKQVKAHVAGLSQIPSKWVNHHVAMSHFDAKLLKHILTKLFKEHEKAHDFDFSQDFSGSFGRGTIDSKTMSAENLESFSTVVKDRAYQEDAYQKTIGAHLSGSFFQYGPNATFMFKNVLRHFLITSGHMDINPLIFAYNNSVVLDNSIITTWVNSYRQQIGESVNQPSDILWSLPKEVAYSVVKPTTAKNYLYEKEPDLDKTLTKSDSESLFARLADASSSVLFWFKQNPDQSLEPESVNGKDSRIGGFSVPYFNQDKRINNFFPDFMLVDKKGVLYILDTKAPLSVEDTTDSALKAEGLATWAVDNSQAVLDKGFTGLVTGLLRYDHKKAQFVLFKDKESYEQKAGRAFTDLNGK